MVKKRGIVALMLLTIFLATTLTVTASNWTLVCTKLNLSQKQCDGWINESKGINDYYVKAFENKTFKNLTYIKKSVINSTYAQKNSVNLSSIKCIKNCNETLSCYKNGTYTKSEVDTKVSSATASVSSTMGNYLTISDGQDRINLMNSTVQNECKEYTDTKTSASMWLGGGALVIALGCLGWVAYLARSG